MRTHLIHGDAVEVLAKMRPNRVDAVVTDPPSGTNMIIPFRESGDDSRYIDFDSPLGRLRYNFQTQHKVNLRFRAEFVKTVWPVLSQLERVLRPGGYGVFWALQRSAHWLAWGLEEAGFSVLDILSRRVHVRRLKSPFVEERYSTQVRQELETWILVRKPGETTASKNREKWGTGYLDIVGEDGGKLTHLFEKVICPKRETEHPTEKPVEWMRTLVRLVTPPKGLVLDPYMGTGSTGVAALAEGRKFVGIERQPEWFEAAKARLDP